MSSFVARLLTYLYRNGPKLAAAGASIPYMMSVCECVCVYLFAFYHLIEPGHTQTGSFIGLILVMSSTAEQQSPAARQRERETKERERR